MVAPPLDDPVAGAPWTALNNLFIANYASSSLEVLPAATGTVFGVPVIADQLTTVVSSGPERLLPARRSTTLGDLFITDVATSSRSTCWPEHVRTLFGVSVTANQLLDRGEWPAQRDRHRHLSSPATSTGTPPTNGTVSVPCRGFLPAPCSELALTADKVTTLVGSGLTEAAQLNSIRRATCASAPPGYVRALLGVDGNTVRHIGDGE